MEEKFELSAERITDITECFKMFDRDQDGIIVGTDLPLILHALGEFPTREEYIEMMAGRTQLTVDDLKDVMRYRASQIDPPEKIADAFKLWDKNDTGFVTVQQLKQAMMTMGHEPMKEEEFEDFVRDANPTPDGRIDYRKFSKLMVSNSVHF